MRAIVEGFLLAMFAVVRHPLRASLTVLGILIGIASVVTVTALGTGARESVGSQIDSLGSNVIMVFPQSSQASGAKGALGSGPRLTEEDGRAILREAVSIDSVAPLLRSGGQVVAGDRNISTQFSGATLSFFKVRNWPVRKGSLWVETDEAVKAKVVVLGDTAAKNLFGSEDPIGRSIRIGRYSFRVLGVLDKKGEAPMGGDQDDIVVMPIGSMRGRIVRTPPGSVGMLLASANSADTVGRAVSQVDAVLRQRHRIEAGREPDFMVRSQQQFAAMQQMIYGFLTILLIGIAAISLVVGGIGVMNIMLVSVSERTREIGIRMAIGAREEDIRTQFLVESTVLSALGGLLGTAVGMAAIAGLSKILGWTMSLDTTTLAIAITTSALVGIVFGFFPARRAARLDPIEALRHE